MGIIDSFRSTNWVNTNTSVVINYGILDVIPSVRSTDSGVDAPSAIDDVIIGLSHMAHLKAYNYGLISAAPLFMGAITIGGSLPSCILRSCSCLRWVHSHTEELVHCDVLKSECIVTLKSRCIVTFKRVSALSHWRVGALWRLIEWVHCHTSAWVRYITLKSECLKWICHSHA